MDNRNNDDKRAKKNKLAAVPDVVAVDDADGSVVRRSKIPSNKSQQRARPSIRWHIIPLLKRMCVIVLYLVLLSSPLNAVYGLDTSSTHSFQVRYK